MAIDADVSVLQISAEGTVDRLETEADLPVKVTVSLEASHTTLNTSFADVSLNPVSIAGNTPQSVIISADVEALSISAEAVTLIQATINADAEVLVISISGQTDPSASDVVPTDSDEYPFIGGNTYIVLNLRTKTHTTYRDGSNEAMAKTGNISFGSSNMKNVSDLVALSRSTGIFSIQVENDEETRRFYQVAQYADDMGKLRNKRRILAKGLKGTNWSFKIVCPAEIFTEVRSMSLVVNETERSF